MLIHDPALHFFVDRVPTNPCAFNLLGTLLEHETLYRQSAEAFERYDI